MIWMKNIVTPLLTLVRFDNIRQQEIRSDRSPEEAMRPVPHGGPLQGRRTYVQVQYRVRWSLVVASGWLNHDYL